jgi:ABC-2 type transport system ATP-binding protein
MNNNIVLDVQNLTKIYKNRIAVNKVNFQIHEGEIFGFIGPNGAGKSTTIKMITGLASISSGNVYISGHSIKTNFESAIRNVGAIIEMPEMYGYMSGYNNLKYYASLYNDVDDNRIHDVAKLVGLENRLRDKVKHYSLGMKQRLGIAQAILHRPNLLILDEPTNGLDPSGIIEIRELLKKLAHEQNIAVMISSHILAEMEVICDTVAIINNGQVVEFKDMEQIKQGLKGEQQVAIVVDYPNYAGKLLIENFNFNVSVKDKTIIVTCDEINTPKLTALLVKKGISIFSATTVTRSLEDIFLSVINGNGKNDTSIK